VQGKLIKNTFLLVAVVALVASTGCGGGSESTSSTAAEAAGNATTPGSEAEGEGGSAGQGQGKEAPQGEVEKAGKGGAGSVPPSKAAKKANGGNAGKAQGSAGISKAEFVKQANSICAGGRKAAQEAIGDYLKGQLAGGGPPGESANLFTEAIRAVFLPAIEKQVDEIRALGAPPGEAQKVNAFLAAMEDGIEASADSSAKVISFKTNFKSAAKLARELGVAACIYR
jgi:hypothetical protein